MRSAPSVLVGAVRRVPGRLLGRLPGRLLGLLPGPPDVNDPADPLLAGIDQLARQEQQAHRRAWLAQNRRGRGDGNG